MHSKNCDAELLNDAMEVMFTHSLRSLDYIPPTEHALFQHAKRALSAAAFIWKQSLSKIPKIPKPSDWGWEWNTNTWMSATHVHCSSIVVVSWPAGAIVSAIGLRCSTLCEGGCTNNDNKAIRDGKYLALPHSSYWRRSPIKIENFDYFS